MYGKLIESKIKEKGYSLKQVSRIIKSSDTTISNAIKEQNVNLGTVFKIINALDMSKRERAPIIEAYIFKKWGIKLTITE